MLSHIFKLLTLRVETLFLERLSTVRFLEMTLRDGYLGDVDAALKAIAQAERHARMNDAANLLVCATVHQVGGAVLLVAGDLIKAKTQIDKSISLFHDLNDPRGIALSRILATELAIAQRDFQLAQVLLLKLFDKLDTLNPYEAVHLGRLDERVAHKGPQQLW